MGREDYDIDFVIPWVDGNDLAWIKEKEDYWTAEGNTSFHDGNESARFRNWENLRYWFRGVEKFAPWVHHIFFVTWGHVPTWLNVEHPKISIVNHHDFIPEQYLPVFSANPIEINFHRIQELSEHFVYFNDDMFLIKEVKKKDFFVNGFPREMGVAYLLTNDGNEDTFQYMLFKMMGEVNKHFDFHSCVKKNFGKWFSLCYGKAIINNMFFARYHNVSGLYTPHVPSSMRKSKMVEVWDVLEESLKETCTHRFRNPNDITQYIFRYWNIMQGNFEPSNFSRYSREFFITDSNNKQLYETIEKQKVKMICINDSIKLTEFEVAKKNVLHSFETILDKKSAYERY